jgi:hypothetical protein
MKTMRWLLVCAIIVASVKPPTARCQAQTNVPAAIPGAKPAGAEHIKIHGAALEGNLEGDAVDRDVIVFLPPSYEKEKKRRYPVVYALHGYSIGAEQWTHEIHVPQTIEGAFAQGAQEMIATAAAWAPDPKNPPLYFDLPTKDGVRQPEIVAKFAANAPLAFVDQYIGNLKQYRAIAMDVGDQDGLRVDAAKLHKILDNYGVVNAFEIYSGTHISAVADRFQNLVLPFFSKNLCFTADCK